MICLIRPPAVDSIRFATTSITLPLGLAYVAGALEHDGQDVQIIDAVGLAPQARSRYYKGYLVGMRLEDIVSRIPTGARAIGISVTFTHEWPAASRLVELVKEARSGATVVLGGEHVTSMPEFCLSTSRADVLVLGEGEETIVELVRALRDGRPLCDVEGIAYRDGDEVVVNRRRLRNLAVDDIPLPAWHHFDIPAYHRHRLIGCEDTLDLTMPILATRGCPYQCTYCSAPNMWSPRWIPRDPKRVVDEIEFYVERYGARNFPFQDLTAIIRKDWIVAFCREILDRDLRITWRLPSGTRAEAIDAEVADVLRRSGMVSMAYAPESGSEETRRIIKKKMHTDRLFASVRAAASADLYVMAFMVIGFPHDRPEHLRDNLPFLEALAREGVADMGISFYMALPGTELFHSLWDQGKIALDRHYFEHILESLSFVPRRSYADALSRLDLTLWKLRMFRAFYAAKRHGAQKGGLVRWVGRSAKGLQSRQDRSRMQTALRNGLRTTWETVGARFKPRWVPRDVERRYFDGWTEIYRRIREKKVAAGIVAPAPTDTTELQRHNVGSALERDHRTPRRLLIDQATG